MAVDWKERAFKSGPWEGRTYGEALGTEEGRAKLRSMIENVPDSSAAEGLRFWYKGFSKWAKEALSSYGEDPEVTEKNDNPLKETVVKALSNQVMALEVRVAKLEAGSQVNNNQKSVGDVVNWDD